MSGTSASCSSSAIQVYPKNSDIGEITVSSIYDMWKSLFQKRPADVRKQKEAGFPFRLARLRLASKPDTEPGVLDKLSTRGTPDVLERVAENESTKSPTLARLAIHEAPEVRSAVADNTNTPVEIIDTLASDESVEVRFAVAENPRVPRRILEHLVEDDNPYVAARARQTLNNIGIV